MDVLKQDAASWRHADGTYVYLESEWLAYQAATERAAKLCENEAERVLPFEEAEGARWCADVIRGSSVREGGEQGVSITLQEARRALKLAQNLVSRLQNEQCAKKGHVKGGGAFDGYSYCKTCGDQVANDDFRGNAQRKGVSP